MAKKLLHSSKITVNKADNTIIVGDIIPLESLLLITDVTANKVIYQFNDLTKGAIASIDGKGSSTTFTLTHDMANDPDILDTNSFQLFYDSADVHIEPSETFVDPVSKFRVSNPENLIDTDFEYGLQSTKWETLQTVNNVPTLYSSGGDVPLEGVTSVESLSGSRQIKVTTNTPHGLSIGDPVSVQGVSDYQSEGFFVVSGVPNALELFYEIDLPATTTGEISGSYTTIVPAKFFEGAALNISNADGAVTDESDQSVLTVKTEATHGFSTKTKLYIRNSVGPKDLQIEDPTGTAPDGRPYVDTVANFNINNQVQAGDTTRGGVQYNSTIAYDWECTHTKYITLTDIDAVNNQITWAAHGLEDKFCLLYNDPILGGGLNRESEGGFYSVDNTKLGRDRNAVVNSTNQVWRLRQDIGCEDGAVYYVSVVDANTIALYEDETLLNQVSLTVPADFDYGFPRLGLVYQISRGGTYNGQSAYWKYTRWNYEDYQTTSINAFAGYSYSYDRYSYWAMSTYAPGWTGTSDPVTVDGLRINTSGLYYYYYYTRVGTPDNGVYSGNIGYRTWYYRGGREYGAYFVSNNNQPSHFSGGAGIRTRQYKNHYGWMYHKVYFKSLTAGNAVGTYSGKDLLTSDYGLGIDEPEAIYAFQGRKRASNRQRSQDTYSYASEIYRKGRFGVLQARNTESLVNVFNNGIFEVATNASSWDDQDAEVYYMFIKTIPTIRNTIFLQNHGIPNGQEVTVSISDAVWNQLNPPGFSNSQNNLIGQHFLFSDSSGNGVFMPQEFQAQINVISDNIFKMEVLQAPFTDDLLEFPDDYSISYTKENELFNTIYIQDHKIVGVEEGTYTAEGLNESNPEVFTITNSGVGDYAISGTRITGTELDPTLVVYRGSSYEFQVNASGHPFYIATSDTSYVSGQYNDEYLVGVTNSRQDVGTVNWLVPLTGPSTLYYYCGSHESMHGTIEVRDAGTEIGGLTNNTLYNVLRKNDARLSIAQTSNSIETAEAAVIGYASNAAQTGVIVDCVSPFSPAVPSEVTITEIQYRGDFSGRFEYLVLQFADGDQYFIGAQNGQDTDQFRKENSFVSKNITELLAGGSTITVDLFPTNQVNFAHGTMSNYYEIKFVLSGGVGSVIFTGTGSGKQNLSFEALDGAYDGIYEINNIPTADTFQITSDIKIPQREYQIVNANVNLSTNVIDFGTDHNFLLGEKVKYDPGQDTVYHFGGDLASNDFYVYAVPTSATESKFASSETLAFEGQTLALAQQANSIHKLRSESIIKANQGVGQIDLVAGSNEISGNGTSFLKQFKRFDKIYIDNGTFTKQFIVARVLTNSRLILFSAPSISLTNRDYFTATELILRPDGYGIHLPFDGGVNITAGTSPDSKIVRQSRKYFRYQSGKGIQNSFAINFNPPRVVRILIKSDGTTAEIETQEAHNLNPGDIVVIENAEVSVGVNEFNGEFTVTSVPTPFSFQYTMDAAPEQEKAAGFPTYYLKNWSDSYVRAGMFDDQNGFFIQYDGQDLSCVRRSSTQQLAGNVNVTRNSQVITGNQTSFTTQLSVNDFVVIRGQSYKVVEVSSDARFIVQPSYRGLDATAVKVTRTVDTIVKQSEWNLDSCDGTGPSGYELDVNRIQMAYADYSWYGAGKIRFGFKDRKGHVKYVHEFVHNNILDESYFRSGNLPGRYEIMNGPNANASPTLFHFGTSVIMDGTFDDDKAYLFTANSKPHAFTNGNESQISIQQDSEFQVITLNGQRVFVYALNVSNVDAQDLKVGMDVREFTPLELPEGTYITQLKEGLSSTTVYTSWPGTTTLPSSATYPNIPNGTTMRFGEEEAVDLSRPIPLISVRLAPSVDSSLTGDIGEREIMNRMQLGLREAGVTSNRDLEVFVILNPQPSNLSFQKVGSPSLSQLIEYNSGDTLESGTVILATKVSAGSTTINLSELLELGNSILGGDSVFPSGPDLLTIAVQPQDTSGVSFSTPITVTGKVSWSESQA